MIRPEDPAASVLRGGGEMGALMRAVDWSETAVGPVEGWPQSLRTALSILLETGFPMYIAWGPELTQFYNDGYRPILGSTKHPCLGKSTRDTFAEIWDIIGPMFAGVFEGTPTTVVDFLLPLDRHGFQEECYFIFSYSPIRQEDGTVGGVLVTVTETSKRVIGERRLRVSQALAARTRDARSVGEACEIAASVLADDPDDLPFAFVYTIDDEVRTARLACAAGLASHATGLPSSFHVRSPEAPWPVGQALETRKPVEVAHLPVELVLRDEAPPASRAVVLPILEHGTGQPVGVLVAGVSARLTLDDDYARFQALLASQIGTAISSARAIEEATARAEALVELDRAKTAFFSNVSHEFRTPLTLMLGPTEDAVTSADRALRGADLETVYRNQLRLLKLVNTLLEFSRVEAGRSAATFEPTDLAEETAGLASGFRSAVERAGLSLTVRCPPLPEPVYVDRSMWETVVLNLLSNALKFTFDGGIELVLSPHGDHVELRVTDTGVGIDGEDLPHVFERFHRSDNARARTYEGSGIGLALVREVCAMHGGTITVDSRVDVGTTFIVRIPFGHAHLPADEIATDPPGKSDRRRAAAFLEEALRWLPDARAPERDAAPVEEGVRILIADDNADMREYLARLLGERWSVEAVGDGRAAVEAARRSAPDVVVTDVMMPGLDGFGVLRALRSDAATREIPVILVSARAGEESRVEGLDAGADEYLIKPFSARELIARVHAQVTRAKVRSVERAHATVLLEAKRQAESANRAKDEFLAMLGHELRNPLAPILTALELMRLEQAGGERERAVIERQVKHVIGLVDDLLDVARITRGGVELSRELIDVADVVARAIEMSAPLIEQRRHTLSVDVRRGLVVDGDPRRLAQVLANLLTNAAKYTDPGGRIAVRSAKDGERARISVADDGLGISREILPHVFDLFTQERQALDRSEGGLGLGLSIVKSLVLAHGGDVEARSDGKGRGTEMVVRLPLARELEPVVHAPRVTPPAPATDGLALLLVDDNEDHAELLARALRRFGHEVRLAHDAPTALDIVGTFRPDAALLDIGLPVMDGLELARRLRSHPHGKDTHLVALTGYGRPDDRHRSRAAGFDSHLVKPVEAEVIDRLLRERASRG